ILLLVLLLLGFVGVREMRRIAALEARGRRTEGRVISSRLRSSGSGDTRSSRLVETIEFVAEGGRSVRGNPSINDTRSVDRSGMLVPVLYDPEEPRVLVAPHDRQPVRRGCPVNTGVVAAAG